MNNVVIIGIGEVVEHVPEDLNQASSPADLIEAAIRQSFGDTGLDTIGASIDTIAMVRTFSDSGAPLKSPFGDPFNPPRAIAKRLGIDPKTAVYSCAGGQVPQQLVNEFATKIARGDCESVLLVGGEALANQKALKKAKIKTDWSDPTEGQVEDRHPEITDAFGIEQMFNEFTNIPAIYTAMEHARRSRLDMDIDTYVDSSSAIFERLSEVASQHPCAMFQRKKSATQISTVSDQNRLITDLYTRDLTAKDGVNQAAAIILMREDNALKLGLDPAKFVYPISGSDATDLPVVYREDISQSVAMQAAYNAAFEAAELSVSDISCMDLYSCFPIAVFAACEALAISPDDPRGLSLTGGLPYFGGPGNNYAMHSIVNVVKRLRADGQGNGLVAANGGFISKHCIGIYSKNAPANGWRQADKDALNAVVENQSGPKVAGHADGRANIEGYSVEFDRTGPKRGFVFGRIEDGRRFVGCTDRDDSETVQELLNSDPIGRAIYVTSKGPGNRFTFSPDKTQALIPKAPNTLDGEFEYCLVKQEGHVLEVTINRPDARNSLTPEANFELERIFDLYQQDRDLWVAIITGAGDKSFSAGNDLKYMGTGKPIWVPETGFAGLTHRKNRSKPVIAAVNGYAFGGGLEIALACDIIVADETAKFALPEVKTGLIAAAGGVFRLPKVLPPHIARDMILTGRTMEIDEAVQFGLVNYKAKAGQALEKAREIAKNVCNVSPTAVAASLEMMNDGAQFADPMDALDQPSHALPRVAASEDLQIGLMAFLMKQKAKWKNR